MALDIRLACLRDAILENWTDLEADGADGTLVIRLKEGVTVIDSQNERESKERSNLALLHATE